MTKTKGSPLFYLRPDPLRWSIAGALMLQPLLALGDGIVPAQGPGGIAQVGEHNGVPVVAIVPPNAQGLSHNPFSDYNVPVQGLVLNNAVAPGDSQLAGTLPANPLFQGQAASIILNEVVGQLPSNLRGPQEIFGQAADYVLANPNGIHVQGVGFINTPRAVFLVGTPEVQDGRLVGLNTFSASGELHISGGGLSTVAAVELIAPRIDSQGQLQAGPALTAIAGRNRLASDSLELLETRQTGEAPSIDLNALGAMRAGRIRMISTREGAGIRLGGPEVKATDSLSIKSAGDITAGRDGNAGPMVLASIRGDLTLDAGQDISLTGSRLAGHNVRAATGRDLTLDPSTHESLREYKDAWSKKTLFITTETWREDSQEKQVRLRGTTVTAQQDLSLSAGRDVKVRASDLLAENAMVISAGNDVTIEGEVESTTRSRQVHHRKHLWRGDRSEHSMSEKAVEARLTAASLDISAKGKATVRGSDLDSKGDLNIRASSIAIQSQGVDRRSSHDDYRGDLVGGGFFKKTSDREETGTRQRRSNLNAEGTTRLVSDDVRISASTVKGKQGAFVVGENGPVIIDSAAQVSHVRERNSNTQLGGTLGTTDSLKRDNQQQVGASLETNGNLDVISAQDIQVIASKVTAKGKLHAAAKGNIDVRSGENSETVETSQSKGSFYADAGETRATEDGKPGSKQYYAEVGHQRETTESTRQSTHRVPSEMRGATAKLVAEGDISVVGSTVESTQGDADLTATNLNVISELNEENSTHLNVKRKLGEQVTGGKERVGAGHTAKQAREAEQTQRATLAQAGVKAAGDMNLDIRDTATYTAAHLEAGGNINEHATEVRRNALNEVDDTQKQRTLHQVDTGVSIDYKELVKPIEKLITGQEQDRKQKQGVEDALVPPSLGGDITASYLNREHGVRTETPAVNQVVAGQVKSDVQNTLYDQGTQYTSTQGGVAITAQTHDAPAVSDKRTETLTRTEGSAGIRVDTVTGSDINVKLSANLSHLRTLDEQETAKTLTVDAKHGFAVQLGTDGRYEGATINTGDGTFSVKTEGDFSMPQAQNRQHKEESDFTGNLLVKGGTAPIGQNGLLIAGATYNTLESTDTQGVGGRIKTGDGDVQVGGDVTLPGVAIDNGHAATERFTVTAGGTVDLPATQDTHQAKGQTLGGAVQVTVSNNPAADAQRTGGSLGGHVEAGRVNEQAQAQAGGALKVKNLTLEAGAHKDVAIRMQGTQLVADTLTLRAPNGGIKVEAASNREEKDNLKVMAGAEVGGSRGLDTADDASAVHARATVDVDKVDSTTYKNADIRVKQLAVDAGMDVQLKGAVVAADQVSGHIGGDLRLGSVKDDVASTQVKVDARIGKETNPHGLLNGLTAVSGPLAGQAKEKIGKQVQGLDQTLTPTLLLDVVHESRDSVAGATSLAGRQGIGLEVAGNTYLDGATLRSTQGKVELGGSEVQLNDLSGRDYRADVSVNASNGPADLLSNVINEFTSKRSEQAKADEHGNMGVIRTGGHDIRQSIKAAVEERR